MAAASNPDNFHIRLIEVLTQGAGLTGQTIAADSFEMGSFDQYMENTEAGALSLAKPLISIENIELEDTGTIPNNYSFTQNRISLSLLLCYKLSQKILIDRKYDVIRKMYTDSHDIRKALTNPGNLTQTEAANDTGLNSGMLMHNLTGRPEIDFDTGIGKLQMDFEGIIELAY